MKAACYARYSSDTQRETSLDDQLRVCREYAAREAWTVLPEHVYTDAAMSGSTLDRPGIQALLAAAGRQQRPFDGLLVDDSSRVSRDQADALRVLQILRFHGVRVIYISQQIDSASPQAETLIAVHGIVDSLYLREMAAKIKRGLAGQIERGLATGGVTFGYRTVPVPDPSGKLDLNGNPVLAGKRVEVVPEEAAVVRRIFELYADGVGVYSVVERLHRDGCRGPRGRRWRAGAVRWLLANEKYLGRLVWGRQSFERRPGTRQLVAREVPREQWRIQERPELRIIDDALWKRVEARRQTVRAALPAGQTLMRGRNAALYSRHLFSGFTTCGECGGAITVVAGGWGQPRYGCQRTWRGGLSACPNRLTIRATIADARLLEGLKAELLAPETVAYITQQCAVALNQRMDERPRLVGDAERARAAVAQRLANLIESIERDGWSASVAGRIRALEAEVAQHQATLAELTGPLPQRLAVMPSSVQQQLEDVAGLLRVDAPPERVKTALQRLRLHVTLSRVGRADGRAFYRATVESDLPGLTGVADLRPAQVDDTRAIGSRKVNTRPATGRSVSDQTASPHVRNLAEFRVLSTVGDSLPRSTR